MKKDPSLHKKLHEILVSQDDQKLTIFEDSNLWKMLSIQEREQLAALFFKRGQSQLKGGLKEGVDSLNITSSLAPHSAQLFYEKGCLLSGQSLNVTFLHSACQAFKEATSLNSQFFEAFHSWGNTLSQIGKVLGESAYFQDSLEKFQEAFRLISEVDSFSNGHFFWNWGQSWHNQGKLSGEADDFRQALKYYERAEEKGIRSPEFWNDSGDAIMELAFLLGKREHLFDAAKSFREALLYAPKFYPALLNLSCVLEYIFEVYGDVEYFKLSHQAFEKAALEETNDASLWLKWGCLHLAHSKINKEMGSLQISFEKFALADACDIDNPLVLMRWSEAQLLFGAHNERIDMLRGAEKKIIRSLEIIPESTESWYIYGTCLNEIGRYFQDEEYYYQAIEKFHYGLSLNQQDALLWYGLALAHFSIGELCDDAPMIEKSSQYCAKVLDLGGKHLHNFWNDWGVTLMKLAEMTNDQSTLEKAIEKFEEAISFQSRDNNSEIDPESLYNYGCALDFLGDFSEDSKYYEQAIHVLSKALQIDSNYSNARYNLALALSHLGEANADVEALQRSLDTFQALLMEDPEDEMGWNDWGLAILHLALLLNDPIQPHSSHSLFEQAEEKLIHAVALGCTQSYYNLACFYSLTNNYPTAIYYMERALQSESLPALNDVLNDEWLEGLRGTTLFRQFVSQITAKYEKNK